MRRLFAAVLALLLAAPVLAGAAGLEPRLQSVLDVFLAENPVAPGVVVHVECPTLGLDWTGVAGTVARDDPAPLTARHTFRIASNTKTYVAASVLRLVETGRLGLDDPLSGRIAPELDALLKSDGYDTDAITLAQVLSHTAGFGDHTNDPRFEERVFADPTHRWTVDEDLRLLVEWREPVGAPGETYRYSDSGYIILGTVVERATGLPLAAAVRGLLDFAGLGLDATCWELLEATPADAAPRAHQYFGELDTTDWAPYFDLYGGGGLVTDAHDLAEFLRHLMRGEVFDDPATLDAMIAGGTPPYRLGLMSLDCGGRELLGHQGFWNTFAFHDRELDLTLAGAVLNHDAANGRELVCRLLAAVTAGP